MKTIKKLLLGAVVMGVMLTTKSFAQDVAKEEFKPVFLTVTTLHRSSDPNVDFSEWEKTEKEYFDKVTNKNDLIVGSGYYFHYFTPDDTEILAVSVYNSWEDIEKSNEISSKLIAEGWPNEAERKAFFEKQSSYYSPIHSDEIYNSRNFRKPLQTSSKEPLIYYVKTNKLGQGGAGFKEYFDNVTMKNSYIKGYNTLRHLWGSNSLDALEVFVFDNFADIEKSFLENSKLEKEHWADKEKATAFFKEYSKIFAGHSDKIYRNVPSLSK